MKYNIYTDGSCIDNGTANAVASWSYVVTDINDNIIEACTGKLIGDKQDNNRAELTAFIKALSYVKESEDCFVIHTDFEALYLFCNGRAKPKANKDLYNKISFLIMQYDERIVVVKVRAHKTKCSIVHFINGIVDKLARKSVSYFKKEVV